MSVSIIIADYDPAWPVQFEKLRERVSGALGPLAVAIEHVGSTSVPGLAAKPIIDIDMAVPTDTDVPESIRRLAEIGYSHGGDLGITGREAFATPPGTYRHHPYLVTIDGREFRRHIAFRDRLRRDSEARVAYEELKRGLADRLDDMQHYVDGKSEFVERILAEELGPDHRA